MIVPLQHGKIRIAGRDDSDIGVAHQRGPGNREAGLFLIRGGEDSDELSGAKPCDAVFTARQASL